MLKDNAQLTLHFGRPAKEPEMMFKLLFLKKLYDLSDERLISSAQTDMAYKYFLGLSPKDKVKTIQQAIQKGVIKSGTIIVDATHIEAAVRPRSVPQVLRELTKNLRKEIYKHAYELPEKPSLEADVSEPSPFWTGSP